MKNKRVKKASSFIFWILCLFLKPVLYLKYRFRFETKTSKAVRRPCLILSNHQTVFDQFAVGVGFRFGINFVGSDSLFRHGFKSRLMKLLVRPIPFAKGSSDTAAVKDMMAVVKSGGAVAMFPSGNRSFFGEESYINPATGKLAKKLGVPLVLVRMRGGFNTKARWMVKPSKGRMRAGVVRIVGTQELAALSEAEVNKIIYDELHFDEFEFNGRAQIVYRGRRKAEYLESALFWCPRCKSMTGMASKCNEFFCKDCGARVKINGMGFFEAVYNAEGLPGTILEWGRMQLEFIKTFDYSGFPAGPVFRDENITLSKAVRAKRQEYLGRGGIALYADRISACGRDFPVEKINDMSLQGIRRLQIYTDEGVFIVDAPARANLFKYMVCGYRLKNRVLNTKEEFYGY